MDLSAGAPGTIASGFVTGATGAGTNLKRCATARAGVGLYDITLDILCDATECDVICVLRTTDLTYFVTHTSDTIKRVSTRTAVPAAADADFTFFVVRHSYGTNI